MELYRSSTPPRAALRPHPRGEGDCMHGPRCETSRREVGSGINIDGHNVPQQLGRYQTTCSIGVLLKRHCDRCFLPS